MPHKQRVTTEALADELDIEEVEGVPLAWVFSHLGLRELGPLIHHVQLHIELLNKFKDAVCSPSSEPQFGLALGHELH